MFFHSGLNEKPTPSGSDDVAVLAGREGRHAARAAADAFVEKLEALIGAVDAVDALRPPEPQLAVVGRGAENIEELAGPDRERFGRGGDDEVLVFLVDPVVGDHFAQQLLGRNVGGAWIRARARDVRV